MYANGNGLPRDIKLGHDMFEKSCALNDARGCANLGLMYQKGISVKIDGKKAVKLLTKSCSMNDPQGCLYLGYAYERGFGVEKILRKLLSPMN